MSDLKYTQSHEWILVEGDLVKVGITDYAQDQLGDIVHVDLPEEGTDIYEGNDVLVIESVKAAGEVASPVTGTVVEVNEALVEEPELVNREPLENGWLFKVRISSELELESFMDAEAYKKFLEGC